MAVYMTKKQVLDCLAEVGVGLGMALPKIINAPDKATAIRDVAMLAKVAEMHESEFAKVILSAIASSLDSADSN